MRKKRERVLSFGGKDDDLPKTVRDYWAKYKGISLALDLVPEVLDLVHGDLTVLSQGGDEGRGADFTSETILRALVVQTVEGLSYRETIVRVPHLIGRALRVLAHAILQRGLDRLVCWRQWSRRRTR